MINEYMRNFMVRVLELFRACDTQGIPQEVDIPIIDQKYLTLIRMFIADKGYTSVFDGDILYVGIDRESIRRYLLIKAMTNMNFIINF